ncbi:hypothetical protein EDC38_1199 [Marinimicrobium koreense]|uniref:Lysozyme inhibitor LprI N-terminal domain-containing protein n=1 Tax=Marinimicrobium koreense TaxID=306545 RepID=A0A3N1NP47_9GAMM|nr:hypothetical protein [Marinimicrobium koreense]ROQ20592.1 hypothetical protein EDC38_1199 [Marinimicrobium koreense]
MKKLFILLSLLVCLPSQACDETCKREAAMEEHGVKFPSYLTASYCQDTSVAFLLRARESLQSYRDEKLTSGHKGGMRNISNFLKQRKQWLEECDQYLALTGQGRVFRDEATTQNILTAIDSTTAELDRLVASGGGVHAPASQAEMAGVRMDQLFMVVDNHRTDLQLRGQLVIR